MRTFTRVLLSALLVLGLALSLSAGLRGATVVVDPSGAGDFTAIQPAIDAAAEGDEVLVKPGEYVIAEPITFRGKGIVVRGEAGAEQTTIRMSDEPSDPDRASVVVFENGETEASVLEGFTLTGGSTSGVRIVSCSPAIMGCTISRNSSENLGGVSCEGGASPTLTDCTIRENSAAVGGGVHCGDGSSPTLRDCTISGNSARYNSGGGVYCFERSSPNMTGCTIAGNWGVAVDSWNESSPTLSSCTISGNSGGAVHCYNNASATLESCIAWGNAGGIYLFSELCNLSASYSCLETEEVWPGDGNTNADPLFCGFSGPREVFVDAASAGPGDGSEGSPFPDLAPALEYGISLQAGSPCIGTGKGGANMGADTGTCGSGGASERVVRVAPGRYSLEGLTLAHGASILGEGAADTILEGTLWGLRAGERLSGVTVTRGTSGGIVIALGESPTIEDCTISGNSSQSSGGGVSVGAYSAATLSSCIISGNSARHEGGGVFFAQYSSATLASCEISGNSADSGGGVCSYQYSLPTLSDCTISGNSARWSGGGVRCVDSSPSFENSTISGNSAGESGGGVGFWFSSPTLTGCIVWGNEGGSWLVYGNPEPAVSWSCLETEDLWPGEGNINVDPLLCGFAGPQDLYVDAGASVPGDGSPASPFGALAPALEYRLSLQAGSPCLGTGKDGSNMGADRGTCDTPGASERRVRAGAGIYSLEGVSLAQRVSILGQGAEDTILEGTLWGLRTGARLSGVTVTRGLSGGIVVSAGESPSIEDCTISGNSRNGSWPGAGGGGVYCGTASSPTISNCTISGNSVRGFEEIRGGGVYCANDSSPAFTSCTISANSGKSGGGVYCVGSSPILTSCTISDNRGTRGGGILGGTLTLSGCRILRNMADEDGGALCSVAGALTNCVIADNRAGKGGVISSGALPFDRCTIAGNAGPESGGVFQAGADALTLRWCIVWNNAGPLGLSGSTLLVTRSCIQGEDVWPGQGNINTDPLFCGWSEAEVSLGEPADLEAALAALDYDLSLRPESPCLALGMGADTGSCDAPGAPELRVRLAAGTYRPGDLVSTYPVHIQGEGSDRTVLSGSVQGLVTGSVLSGLTVEGTLIAARAEAPEIRECAVTGGVLCLEGSLPIFEDCAISGNPGAGVTCRGGSRPQLSNCTIRANLGHGLECFGDAAPALTRCTIAGNLQSGVACEETSSPTLERSIVWDNGWGSVGGDESAPIAIARSCIEGDEVWPGEGNIRDDPLFCGWPQAEVAVGSQTELESALAGHDLALRAESPCLALEMGSGTGVCATAGEKALVVRLSSGEYSVEGLIVVQHVSLAGAGREQTTLTGTLEGLRTGSTLSGVTVTGGARAGIRLESGQSPSIEDCAITGNSAVSGGGGVYCRKSSPTLTSCTISENSLAGVVCSEGASPTLSHCTISENSGSGVSWRGNSSPTLTNCTISENSGDGVRCGDNSSPTLTGCSISGNTGGGVLCPLECSATLSGCTISENSGTGVYCASASPTLASCTISGNSAWVGAGIVCSGDSFPTLTDCTISGNSATGDGGGVICRDTSSPALARCTISGNVAAGAGGGVCCAKGSSAILSRCTISGSQASRGDGVFCSGKSLPMLESCIVWGNAGGSWLVDSNSTPTVSWSCLETDEVWPGEGNINSDPLFCGFAGSGDMYVDAASAGPGDGSPGSPFRDLARAFESSLSLQTGSPCIGTGKDGADMGADNGTCDAGGASGRVVHLSPGCYSLGGLTFSDGVSIVGEGAQETILEGTVWGLRAGARLARVTVTGGTRGGIFVAAGESPTIEDCTISGNSTSDEGGGVHCAEGSSPTLSGCTILGNQASSGGGVFCEGEPSPTIENCTISGNSAYYGGGVYCEYSSPTLTGCTISGNTASSGGGGGLSCYFSSPTLERCTISGNSARSMWGAGGGVSCTGRSSPRLTSCTIRGNSAPEGGGVYCGGDTSTSPALTNCTISGNSAREGGGVYCDGARPKLEGCIAWGNAGGSWVVEAPSTPSVAYSCLETGGVWPGEGNINLDPLFCGFAGPEEVFVNAARAGPGDGSEQNPFRDLVPALEFSLSLRAGSPCIGTGRDGADMGADTGPCEPGGSSERVVHLAPGRYPVTGLLLASGASIIGEGAEATVLEGTLLGLRTGARLSRVTVTGGDRGGIVVSAWESPTIEDCAISGNAVAENEPGGGGGVCCWIGSSPTLAGCTISSNFAEYTYGGGGGGVFCYEDSTPVLVDCAILGNSARRGGGIMCDGRSRPTLSSCTIAGNTASSGGGGGIYCDSSASATLTNCTVSGNRASGEGGGIYCGSSVSAALTNCIVWGNTPESVCGEALHCLTEEDPLFVHPGVFEFWHYIDVEIAGVRHRIPDFIVEPPDYRLRPGSPAIDAGTCDGAPQTDIEGTPRPQGAGCDIGAYEYAGPFDVAFRRGDANSDGMVNISDAITGLMYLFLGGAQPACLESADADDTGAIDLADAVYLLGHLFLGSPAPPSPYPGCGADETEDALGCERHSPCER